MTPEFGAATQLEKIDMLDFADLVAINKFDKRGALDALRDVKKQYMRNNDLWDIPQDKLPVFGTIASQFNDPGMNQLYGAIMDELAKKTNSNLNSSYEVSDEMSEKIFVIPPSRVRYLSEISENNRAYDKKVVEQVEVAQKLYGIYKTICSLANIIPAQEVSFLTKSGLKVDEILQYALNNNHIVSERLTGEAKQAFNEEFVALSPTPELELLVTAVDGAPRRTDL